MFTLQQVCFDSEMSNAEVLEELAALKEAAKEAKQENRKAKIEAEVAKVRSAGNKRSVSKLMEILYLLDDADEPWLKLGQKAVQDGAKVVNAGNIDKVNLAIEAQVDKLTELRALVRKELGMYAVATVSGLGWELVTSMERNPELNKELHGWDMEEVRANEKKLLQYNREMSAATKGENTILNFVEIQFSLGRQGWRGP